MQFFENCLTTQNVVESYSILTENIYLHLGTLYLLRKGVTPVACDKRTV
jgi:hypothetical protein